MIRVLLAEDQAMVRGALVALLRLEGEGRILVEESFEKIMTNAVVRDVYLGRHKAA